MGDFDLTILPKNRRSVQFGYSPERYSGPAFTNYHVGGNEFNFLSETEIARQRFPRRRRRQAGTNRFFVPAGLSRFRDDSFVNLGPTPGINLNPTAASLTSFNRNEPARGDVNYTRFSAHTLVPKRLDITGRIVYSKATSSYNFIESFTGRNWNPGVTGWPPTPPAATPNILNLGQYNITGEPERPNTLGDIGVTLLATDKLRISNTFRVETSRSTAPPCSAISSRSRAAQPANRHRWLSTIWMQPDHQVSQVSEHNRRRLPVQYSLCVPLGYRYGNRHIEETSTASTRFQRFTNTAAGAHFE